MNEEAVKHSEAEAKFFHCHVTKFIFLYKRVRPDIQTAVTFLSTRVHSPDVDHYKKLTRTLKYLRATAELMLTLQADNLTKINWWVDASNIRSHTGVVISLDGGAIYESSTKQKLNTRSLTEAELVGVKDALMQVLWARKFLREQGFGDSNPVMYQESQSLMLLEKHGTGSSVIQSCHIDVWNYFVKDCIGSKEISGIHSDWLNGATSQNHWEECCLSNFMIWSWILVLILYDMSCRITGLCCVLSVMNIEMWDKFKV